MRLHIAKCLTKKVQSKSPALGWTPARDAWRGRSAGRLLKRRGKDSQTELSSPDVGCVDFCLGFLVFFVGVLFFVFFFRRGARIKSEV